ncbi:MAG: hypothetical protein K6F98_06435 [Bacteroidales bacterium]|nr:hypothetical protein [Bacteroidales bacterium]MCR5714549.1 hypothetical protein [Bacteroidales bacterium]
MYITAYSRITSSHVLLNGQPVQIERTDKDWLADIYGHLGIRYPKFFKMDMLCKAGFLAAEMVMPAIADVKRDEAGLTHDTAVLLFNRSASLENDTAYAHTITPADYFPSPALFVYTLPNILTGEIAIRHRLAGETVCYIDEAFHADTVYQAVADCFRTTPVVNVLCGWAEYYAGHCDILAVTVRRGREGLMPFTEKNLQNCYTNI